MEQWAIVYSSQELATTPFAMVIAIVVYTPQPAGAITACGVVHTLIASLHEKYPAILLSGVRDALLSQLLPTFRKFVVCTARGDSTPELFFPNVEDEYKSTVLPLPR